MKTFSKKEIEEIVGKNSILKDDNFTSKFNYVKGLDYFDDLFNDGTISKENCELHIVSYPKGLVFQILIGIGIKNYSYPLKNNEIISSSIEEKSTTDQILKITLKSTEEIILSFNANEIKLNQIHNFFPISLIQGNTRNSNTVEENKLTKKINPINKNNIMFTNNNISNLQILKIVSIFSGVLIVISFFMPWVNVIFSTASAWDLFKLPLNEIFDPKINSDSMGIYFLLLLIILPVCAVVYIIAEIKTFYNMNSISKIPKFIIVILVSIIIIFLFLKDLENDLSAFVSIFDLIESGFYITIFSAIFLIVDLIIRDRLELFFSSSKRSQSKMYNYCPNCGYKYLVQDKGKFCSNCGAEL